MSIFFQIAESRVTFFASRELNQMYEGSLSIVVVACISDEGK